MPNSSQQLKVFIASEATIDVIPVDESVWLNAEVITTDDPIFKITEKTSQETITGTGLPQGQSITRESTEGTIPRHFRVDTRADFELLKTCFGPEFKAQITGYLAISYEGSEESAKFIIDDTANQLLCSIGDFGSEVPDPIFTDGPPGDGIIDFDDIDVDTLGKAQTLIDGLTGYTCARYGDPNASITTVTNPVLKLVLSQPPYIDGIFQGKGSRVYVFFSSTTSGIYLRATQHTINIDHPTFSMHVQGIDSDGVKHDYNGCGVDSFNTTIDVEGGHINGTYNFFGHGEFPSTKFSGVLPPSGRKRKVTPPNIITYTNGAIDATNSLKTINFTINNGSSITASMGIGQLTPTGAHVPGSVSLEGDLTAIFDTENTKYSTFCETETYPSFVIEMGNAEYIGGDTNYPYQAIFAFEYLSFSNKRKPGGNPVREISCNFMATNGHQNYSPPIRFYSINDVP
jgi:hypothetical protein